MHHIGEHVCTLPKEPKCSSIAPTASWWRHLQCRIRLLGLACDWHQGAVDNLRSRANVEAERKRHITSGLWYILHPYSPARFAWQCWVAVVWSLVLVYVPFLAFREGKRGYDAMIELSNYIAVADITINFFSGYYDPHSKDIILEHYKIASNYIRGSFLFDVLAAIPFTEFNLLTPTAIEKNENCFHMVKIFRFITLRKYRAVLIQQLQLSYATVTLTACAAQTFFFLHWLTYIYYQFPIFMAHFNNGKIPKNSWLNMKEVVTTEPTFINLYSASFFYVTGLAIGAGYYNPAEDNLVDEILLSVAIAIAGLLFFAYIMMALLRLGMNYSYQVYSFNAKVKEVEDYMRDLHLPAYLQRRILLHLNDKYDGHIFNEEMIMNTLSGPMKQEIALFCSRRLLENSVLCRDLPVTLLAVIATFVKFDTYLTGDTLIDNGQMCDSMFFIARGSAAVFSSDGREVKHLSTEYQFGEASLLDSSQKSNAKVVAIEICKVQRLQRSDFQQCLAPYKHLKRRVEEAARGLENLNLLTDIDHDLH